MNTQQGSELFNAIVAAPFGAMGIRTEEGRLRELVYLPPHYQEKAPQDACAEQAAQQVLRYFDDADFRFELPLFEAGAQGEHKLLRGFLPSPTYSSHWIRHPGLAAAIAEHCALEARSVDAELAELAKFGPYRDGGGDDE